MSTWEPRRVAAGHTVRWAAHNTRVWLAKPYGRPPTRGGGLLLLALWLALVFEPQLGRWASHLSGWVVFLACAGVLVLLFCRSFVREIIRVRRGR